jgi:tRNA (guanine9-N1)-methyltransferase
MKNHSAESIELASLDDKLVHNSEAMNTDQDVLSKSQLKRIRKEELWKLRKIQKKSLRHEKFHQEASVITGDSSGAEKQSNVEIEEISRHDTGEYVNMPTSQNSSKKNLYKQNFLELCSKSFSVIIDCSFETQHTIKTLKSLSQQIMFCYGINKRSNHPSLIHLTEIGPKLSDQLSKTLCQNWVGVTFDKCSYLESDLYTTDITKDESSVENVMKKELVYLTSDSPNIIEELSPRCAYIIGGIVDRNSFKGLTFKKASEQVKRSKST